MNTKTIVMQAAAALIAFVSLGHAAQAADPTSDPPAKSVVSFADLDVAAPQGADRLYHRIAAAAQHVCGGDENVRAVADQIRVQICISQSIERAVTAVNQPALTALLAAKIGRTAPATLVATRR